MRRAGLMVTNDTGPRHIAAAFGVPTVTLYGPTDPRWTTLPEDGRGASRIDIVAEPNLPEGRLADDEPELCRVEKISPARVVEAIEDLLGG